MISRWLALLAVLTALPALPVAQQVSVAISTAKAPAGADPYRDEPFVFERYDTTTTMQADGTGDVLQHVIVLVQSDGVARQFSVLNLSTPRPTPPRAWTTCACTKLTAAP